MKTIIEKAVSKFEKILIPNFQMVFGIWVDGYTYWLHNQNEKIITKEKLTVKIKQEYMISKIRNSEVFITNHDQLTKNIKLIIMHRYIHASKDHLTFISPTEQVIFHLANSKIFLVNGHSEGKAIQQATIQPFWNLNTDQMWISEKNGTLKYLPMAKGFAVSMFTLDLCILSKDTKKASTWTIQGDTKNELLHVNQNLLKNTLAFPSKR
jgi:hypothetical protein